MYLVKN
jgi:hypothetical protein